MAKYSELIKNFDKIRDYMRDFFIYGCRTRNDYAFKSLRTYDNEKRRIESWIGDYFKTYQTAKGKVVSVSLDSGRLSENPLYNCWKAKSFTDNDIRLHFLLLDVLDEKVPVSVEEVADRILSEYGMYFDSQLIRLKLKEYCEEGILLSRRIGRKQYYFKSPDTLESISADISGIKEMILFFSEEAPFGVVGHFLMQNADWKNRLFLRKHSFIVHTLDDGILLQLVQAMEEKRMVEMTCFGKQKVERLVWGVPLCIHTSVQTGRNYLIMYQFERKRFQSMRLDYIRTLHLREACPSYDTLLEKYRRNAKHCWGISFGDIRHRGNQEHLRLVLQIDEKTEAFVIDRLQREGRGGTVSRLGQNVYCYENDLFDVREAYPWIKTFTGRILSFQTDNKELQWQFYYDMRQLKQLYGGD